MLLHIYLPLYGEMFVHFSSVVIITTDLTALNTTFMVGITSEAGYAHHFITITKIHGCMPL